MSSKKGSQWEREICYRLSKWWTGKDEELLFWRVANSGGQATVRSRKGKKTSGAYADIRSIDPKGEPLTKLVSLELKRGYSGKSIADLLDKPAKSAVQLYEGWVDKLINTQKEAGTHSWMLITRRDRREALVFMPRKLFHMFSDDGNNWDLAMAMPHFAMDVMIKDIVLSIFALHLETFLNLVSPELVVKLVKRLEKQENV